MKSAIVALCFVACAYAAVVDKEAQVLRSVSEANSDGSYNYAYEIDNGINAQAQSNLKVIGKDEVAQNVAGSYQFTSPEGKVFTLTYVADENGYRPQGEHLPTPPAPVPIPEYIARALEYIAAHPYKEEKKN